MLDAQIKKAPKGLFKSQRVAYFLATAFLALGLAFTTALALGAAGAAAGAAGAFSAARLSRSALISAASLFLRSVSLAIAAVIFAVALATLETAAFLGAAFATGFAALAAFAGAVIFLVVVTALGADFFAVAIFKISI